MLERALAIAPGDPDVLVNKAVTVSERRGDFRRHEPSSTDSNFAYEPEAVEDACVINQLILERRYRGSGAPAWSEKLARTDTTSE